MRRLVEVPVFRYTINVAGNDQQRAGALPATFTARTDDEDIAADVASARGTTMEDRARILESLCRMAAELTAQHPDPQRVLDWRDPLPAASEALLARLRAAYRSRRDGERPPDSP